MTCAYLNGIEANGAEMLRLACCLATEMGVNVVAPIHDAVMVEGPIDLIDDIVARTQAAMVEASEVVLDGFRLRTDAKIVKYPDRLLDDKTRPMWDRILGVLEQVDPDSTRR